MRSKELNSFKIRSEIQTRSFIKHNIQVERTPSEQRAHEAALRAKYRQQRMQLLEEDSMKAQKVLAKVKTFSSSSIDTTLSQDEQEVTS